MHANQADFNAHCETDSCVEDGTEEHCGRQASDEAADEKANQMGLTWEGVLAARLVYGRSAGTIPRFDGSKPPTAILARARLQRLPSRLAAHNLSILVAALYRLRC